ncbi:hypothetical protein L6164_030140 [Bauhinia variegata]|uniref:Uncharacterized protein n=1 Tax=Bauhinia variegata TaxID=167791 RepID=A0ACB9LBH7_BAUVA|nr:hypothetical protein L6164_030140 [Bauhinia variegata]
MSKLDEKCNSLDGFMNDSGQFDEQFECLKQQMEDLYLSVATEDDSCLPQSALGASLSIADARWEGRYLETGASEGNSSRSDRSEKENSCLSETDALLHVGSSDHKVFVDKILEELNKLRLNEFKKDQKISSLEKELV